MLDSLAVPDSLRNLAALVSAGDLDTAKRQGRKMLDTADLHSLEIIAECVRIMETRPRIAADLLRQFWRSVESDNDRAIIAACAPKPGEQRERTEPTPDRPAHWTRQAIEQERQRATRPVTTSVRSDVRRKRDERQRTQESAEVRAYFRDRAEVDDEPQPADVPDGYAIDYDKAALHDLRGLPCVRCWLERSNADTHTDRVRAGHGDDGLCGQCRESGRPGLPELPAGHRRDEAIAVRCAFIAANLSPVAARSILRKEWCRRAAPADRVILAEWVQAHDDLIGQAAPVPAAPAAPAPVACQTCGAVRAVRYGLCADCRTLADDNTQCGFCEGDISDMPGYEYCSAQCSEAAYQTSLPATSEADQVAA
jgi:hypothetical protein